MTGGEMSTIAAGLIGRDILRSASRQIHEAEAAALGLALIYRLVDFSHLGLADAQLGPTLDFLAGIDFAGVNVTHPFKQAVIPLLDEIDETAHALGAVNCVQFVGGRKIGTNSDWVGFQWLLESQLAGASLDVVAQIGAGGAGSATAYALLRAGVTTLRLFDPVTDRARALANRLTPFFPTARIKIARCATEAIGGSAGVVQATPIGMTTHPGTPFNPALLERAQWFADIVYFPRETEMVKQASALGLRAVGGAAMVIGQAVQPFRMFTGVDPDPARMMRDMQERDAAASSSLRRFAVS